MAAYRKLAYSGTKKKMKMMKTTVRSVPDGSDNNSLNVDSKNTAALLSLVFVYKCDISHFLFCFKSCHVMSWGVGVKNASHNRLREGGMDLVGPPWVWSYGRWALVWVSGWPMSPDLLVEAMIAQKDHQLEATRSKTSMIKLPTEGRVCVWRI